VRIGACGCRVELPACVVLRVSLRSVCSLLSPALALPVDRCVPAPARSGAGPVGCMVAGQREGTGAERVGTRELGAHALLSAPIYPSFEAPLGASV